MATQSKSGSGSRSKSRSNSGGNGSSPSQSSRSRSSARQTSSNGSGGGEPDVLLDVPQLKVEEIGMEVDNLHARIALEARLGDLLYLHVGADVTVDRVALEIKGVDAQAQLKARLDRVSEILERTLETIDQNPKILTELAKAEQDAVEAGSSS